MTRHEWGMFTSAGNRSITAKFDPLTYSFYLTDSEE